MKNESKKHFSNKRSPSIDGISSRPMFRFDEENKAQGSVSPTSSNRDLPGVVGNFERKDGFYSSGQSVSSSPYRDSQNTFVIERNETKKKGFKKDKNQYNLSSKKPKSRKKKFLIGFLIFFTIVALVTGFLFFKGYLTIKKVLSGGGGAAALTKNVDPSKLAGEGDGRVNILLLGRGGDGHEGPDLTDTLILASIDPIANEASLVSIPRDLWVPVQKQGSMKINAAFSVGKEKYLESNTPITDKVRQDADNAGFETIESTIENVLGVPVHYHFMVDFTGFQQAVDNVGGVYVNAPDSVVEKMRINGKDYLLNVKAGWQTMDGFKALAYSRSRHTSPRGDFDRAERQRVLISALKDKIFSPSTFSNPQKISNLLTTFGNHVQTNFGVNDLQRLYEISQKIPSDKISSVGLADPPNNFVKTGTIDGLSVVIPSAGVANFKSIQSYIRNTLRDSFIRNENASVMVLNGTNKAGMATEKGDELKSYGYTVTKVDNAPTRNYPKTIIVDLRGGSKKYTKNYLEKRFGVSSVNSIPDPAIIPESADFVIILGNDQISASNQ